MKKEDLKVGMVLEMEDKSDTTRELCMILPTAHGDLCVSGKKMWFPLDSLNDNLETFRRKVIKIWGLSSSNYAAHRLETLDRTLLWERKEPKELTVSQIEELLGYPVKIVKED